jgi:hypothetical protein
MRIDRSGREMGRTAGLAVAGIAGMAALVAALLLQEGSWGASHGLHEPDPDAESDRELSRKAERGAEIERATERPSRRPWWRFLRRARR